MKITLIILSLLFGVINQIQAYQYRNYIFYWEMNGADYWKVFLKTGDEYKGLLWRNRKFPEKTYHLNELVNIFSGNHTNLLSLDFEDPKTLSSGKAPFISGTKAYEGNNSFILSEACQYSPGFGIIIDSLTTTSDLNLTAEFYFYSESELKSNPFSVVFSIENSDGIVNMSNLNSEGGDAKAHQWNKIVFSKGISEKYPAKDNMIKVYIWYRGKNRLFIDNLTVDLYSEKDQDR